MPTFLNDGRTAALFLFNHIITRFGVQHAIVTDHGAPCQYDKSVQPRAFAEGDFVLVYDQAHDKLGTGKLEPMWHSPYIVKRVLHRGAYELVDHDGISLGEPRNGLYLKKYYA